MEPHKPPKRLTDQLSRLKKTEAGKVEQEPFSIFSLRRRQREELLQEAEMRQTDPVESAPKRKPSPSVSRLGWDEVGYAPSRHYGTFLAELRQKHEELGESAVRALRCPY